MWREGGGLTVAADLAVIGMTALGKAVIRGNSAQINKN
jgi:hypothetical protein